MVVVCRYLCAGGGSDDLDDLRRGVAGGCGGGGGVRRRRGLYSRAHERERQDHSRPRHTASSVHAGHLVLLLHSTVPSRLTSPHVGHKVRGTRY